MLMIEAGNVKITSCDVVSEVLGALHVDSQEGRHRGVRGQSSDASVGLS